MARNPADPPSSERSTTAHEPSEEPDANGERYEPVALVRHVKDDGRALILYTHAGNGEA